MGIGSLISGAISAVGGAISGALSSVASGVSLICGSLGSAKIATTVAGLLSPLSVFQKIEIFLVVLSIVADIVSTVAERLGLKEENETPEELAMKAEKADKKPEDFDSTESYVEYIRNEIKLDTEEQEKLKNMSPEERAKYQIVGSSLYMMEIQEKYKVDIPVEFWVDMAKMKATGEEVKSYIDTFNDKGIHSMTDMMEYMRGKENLSSGNKKSTVSEAMVEAYREVNPDLSEDDIYKRINSMNIED